MTTTSNAAASAWAAARVAGVGGDPGAVAEQRAAGALGGGIDGEHRDGALLGAPDPDELCQ
jgi:hypothetical protein